MEENEKEFPIIELEKFVEIKKEDDLNELFSLINQILIFQSTNEKIIKFNPFIFEKYIEYNDKVNLNIIILKFIIDTIIKKDNRIKIKYNIKK